jgi:hypothetical protein
MAYAGTTSTSPNPPQLISDSLGSTYGGGAREWRYDSTHTQAEAAAAGFITDGYYLGMKTGDSVRVYGSTTFVMSMHAVSAVTTTGATLSAGLLISSAS